MGLFLYPDQPVLTAAVFDLVGREVSATGLGVVSFASVLMATASPLSRERCTKRRVSPQPPTTSHRCSPSRR